MGGEGGCRRDKIEQKGVDEVDERGIEQANENHKHTQKCGDRNHVCHNINICICHFSLNKGIEKRTTLVLITPQIKEIARKAPCREESPLMRS